MSWKHRHGVLMIVLGVIAFAAAGGCDRDDTIRSDLSEPQANQILVALQDHGISNCRKESDRSQRGTKWKVIGPPADSRNAMQLLERLQLPKEARGCIGDMLKDKPLFPSPAYDRLSLEYAAETELEEMLESIDRVLSAQVGVVMPDQSMRNKRGIDNPRAGVSVLINFLDPRPPLMPIEDASDTVDSEPMGSESGPPPNRPPITREEVCRLMRGAVDSIDCDEQIEVVFKAVTDPSRLPAQAVQRAEIMNVPFAKAGAFMLSIITILAVIIVCLTIHIRRFHGRMQKHAVQREHSAGAGVVA